MLPRIEKIIYRTDNKLYLKFVDGNIKVLNVNSLKMPKNQIDIVKDKWKKARVGDMGHLQFSKIINIGADTVWALSENINTKELLEIVENKKVAKKKIMQSLASLL